MSEMMRETMNDKVYLVTGAAGFLGGTICRELLEKNKVMNLTAITEPEAVAKLHFADCTSGYQPVRSDLSCGGIYTAVPMEMQINENDRYGSFAASERNTVRFDAA